MSVLTGLTSGVIGAIVLGITYIVGKIGQVLMTLAASLIDIALEVNKLILNSPIVTEGWRIVLDLANLGFVLAIIVIAFATILRLESYAMKQTLWKLIVAALLVNFSLVIAGAFISSSDTVTALFSDQFKQVDLSTKLTGLLEVQSLNNPFDQNTGSLEKYGMWYSRQVLGPVADWIYEVSSGDSKAPASPTLESTLPLIVTGIFAVIFTLLSAFVMLAIGIMLFIRYVYLGVLLILSPIVWLLWIFPNTQHLWQKWWNSFLRWVFFAPLSLFFLYLAIFALEKPPATQQQIINQQQQEFVKNLSEKQKGVEIPLAKYGNMIILLGLLMGGLIAANSLSITGSKTAMGAAQGAGKMFGGWVGKKGVALGTRPLRGEWGRKVTEGMQKFGAGRGALGRLMTAPVRHLGTAVSGVGVGQGEKLIKNAGERLNKRFINDKNLANAWDTLSRDEKIAGAKRFMKNKTMNLLSDEQLNRDIGNEGTKKYFERHGEKKSYEDFEKAAMRNTSMVNSKSATQRGIEAEKFFRSSYSVKDFETVRTKSMYEDATAAQNIKIVLETHPGALGKIMPKLDGKDFDKLHELIKESVMTKDSSGNVVIPTGQTIAGQKVGVAKNIKDITAEETERYLGEAKKIDAKLGAIHKSFSKNLGNRVIGSSWEYIPPATT
ncbi:MAG: hypothetical protein AAB516_01890 [Patescibacteria group bacterium]